MTIRVALEHHTAYRFDRPVTVHPHVVRLTPAPHTRTAISAYSLTVKPAGHFINWQQDAFGNHLARLVFPEKVRELEITVDLVADLTVINPFDFFVEDYAQRFPFSYPPELAADLDPYLHTEVGPLLREWLDAAPALPADGLPIVDFLVQVNQRVQRDIAYSLRLETGVQTPEITLGKALGSCRDSAWLLVAVLRELGLAARFVSGYLVQLAPDAALAAPLAASLDASSNTAPADQPAGPGGDFTDLHAWAEVYIPGAGWIGLDATSGLFAGEGHIPLSATPNPAASAPVTGAIEPAEVSFEFYNRVTRIHEDPRVTKPYSPRDWQRIDALGHQVDGLLRQGDVRLTMGGEPTFVSAADMEAAEWNTAADGPGKRALAAQLTARLVDRWAPGGLVQHGQGKWYPGEPLPRWQSAITWRGDGQPIWRDPSLLDTPWSAGAPLFDDASARPDDDMAGRLAAEIAVRLGVPTDLAVPAYEDPLHTVRRHGEAGLTALAAELQALDADPGRPTGWVVPIFRTLDGVAWGTARWQLPRGRLYLVPGSSPLGLRLPLATIARTPPPPVPERSRFEPGAALSSAAEPRFEGGVEAAQLLDIDDSPRTALCVEERDGHVFVFLPPLIELPDALFVVRAVEGAASVLGRPVVLEGYPLPGDATITTITVTPDPGVIEVNVQPTQSWPELVQLTQSLYADAAACGLATEKFDLDGLHTGTGGGNHITLGGATPADSPLLRRPDLLRSLVTYWQNHPSLSYLFSGRFIGPTSQAPRADEARPETLYELEIAFAELDRLCDVRDGDDQRVPPRPWLIDRLLRHLLTDVTGNTHRAEFCVDKLYSPDSQRGRLGLLELRGFEMPPHPQLALVQNLLVRALVARFWEHPYRAPLVRWGTLLHDRFLLPAFVAADIADVAVDLQEHGIDFDAAWIEPFVEFRFARLGEVDVAGVHLELRQAIEPWHVLGEEVSGSGTSRYVDSSVERVQLLATGLVAGRHVVTCNGVLLPLTAAPLGSAHVGAAPLAGGGPVGGGYIAGVRYRAWAPPSALHPTIGVHSPLTFDLIDLWNGRSLGGFTHHVIHPGGRSYHRYPVNAAEAEARRATRFVAAGHTPGPIEVAVAAPAGEYPCTLDLRRSTAASPRRPGPR